MPEQRCRTQAFDFSIDFLFILDLVSLLVALALLPPRQQRKGVMISQLGRGVAVVEAGRLQAVPRLG